MKIKSVLSTLSKKKRFHIISAIRESRRINRTQRLQNCFEIIIIVIDEVLCRAKFTASSLVLSKNYFDEKQSKAFV